MFPHRAFIRNWLGQGEDLRADIQRYELLTRHLGKIPASRFRLDWMLFDRPDGAGSSIAIWPAAT